MKWFILQGLTERYVIKMIVFTKKKISSNDGDFYVQSHLSRQFFKGLQNRTSINSNKNLWIQLWNMFWEIVNPYGYSQQQGQSILNVALIFFCEIAAYVQLNVDISQLYITFFPAIESFTNLFLLSGKGKVIKSRQWEKWYLRYQLGINSHQITFH